MLQAKFEDYVAERNLRSARLLSVLAALLMPSGVVLDWFTHRENVALLFELRLVAAGIAMACFGLSYHPKAVRHVYALGVAPILAVAACLGVMIQNLEGYSSPYYAGLTQALFALGVIFYWQIGRILFACALVVGIWLIPALLQLQTVEAGPFVNNLFALTVPAAIAVASNVSRFAAVRREYDARSELVNALDRLKELDQVKSQFFSNITHELRTPITMILAPLEGLLDGELGHLRTDQKEYLRPIQHNALKLLRLINDLLDLAKMEERYLRLRVEQTDLLALVSEIVEHAGPLAARKDIRLELEVRGSRPDLQVDLEKMERALVNLLSNALKFTDPGGRVTLWMEADAQEVRVGIRDTGIGIAPDQLDRVFERFSQADGSATRRYGGTGIGLALAKEIVELHGGSITVTSTEGAGSEFVVHLRPGGAHLRPEILDRRQSVRPAAEARRGEDRGPREWTRVLLERKDFRFLDIQEATERRVAVRTQSRPKPSKVLVVEDNTDVLRFVNLQLREDHDVYLAQDGKKGLELALRELPDVIVTDYMMPEMDGLSLLRALRADPRTEQIPVIMLTAKSEVKDRIDAREAGAEAYLSKPFSPRELRAAVGQLLEQRGRQLSLTVHEQVKSLEIISAGLAHEIHNPLNYITNSLFIIHEAVDQIRQAASNPASGVDVATAVSKSHDKIERMYQIAVKGTERIHRIVELVRNYAREGYPREPTSICLDAVIEDMAPLLAPTHEHEIRVHLDLNARDQKVTCIPDEIQQAIGCLWQNAFDAVGPGGHVTIRTRCEDSWLLLDVIDDGHGIPREQLGNIFVPFFTTKPPRQGLGLGLPIAYQVIHQAGGTISVESVERQGTTFRVRLPSTPAAQT